MAIKEKRGPWYFVIVLIDSKKQYAETNRNKNITIRITIKIRAHPFLYT